MFPILEVIYDIGMENVTYSLEFENPNVFLIKLSCLYSLGHVTKTISRPKCFQMKVTNFPHNCSKLKIYS